MNKNTGGSALRLDHTLLSNQLLKLLLGQDLHAQLLRLVQLAAGLLAGDEVVGVLRDARGGVAAVAGDQLLDLVAAVFRERAGDDQRLAFQLPAEPRGCGRSTSIFTPSALQVVDRLPAELAVQEVVDALGDDRADLVGLAQLLDARPPAGRPSSRNARPAPSPRARRRGGSTGRSAAGPGRGSCWPRCRPADCRPICGPSAPGSSSWSCRSSSRYRSP